MASREPDNCMSLFSNPFDAWTRIAMKTGEMMMASAQVINHRTRRMAEAGVNPNAHDQREFMLMGQEKVAAMAEATHAVGAQMMRLNPLFGQQALADLVSSSTAWWSLAGSRTPAESLAHQVELMKVLGRSAMSVSTLSDSAASVIHHGLRPIHARATANAKRLSKKRI